MAFRTLRSNGSRNRANGPFSSSSKRAFNEMLSSSFNRLRRSTKGVGVAKGAALRDARARNITTPMNVADAFEKILVWPRIMEQAADFVPNTFTAGQPLLRRTRLVRKADWLQLDASVVLEMNDTEMAMTHVRAHVLELIAT